jgi:hypothetical protein
LGKRKSAFDKGVEKYSGIMKKILLISPHFPPSNLAAVHRARLFALHLQSFGWEPIILTVHEKYYEEQPDWNLAKLVQPGLRIEKTKAMKATRPRLIGDIGLRGFWPMYRSAKDLVLREKIDFVYILIPSYYAALIGRLLHKSTGVKYGIDYIDPWVHEFPGSNKMFSRAWFSTRLAKFLEPIAVKKASLITGVAEGYYTGVLNRNPALAKKVVTGAMPYGGEINDFRNLDELNLHPYLFKKEPGKIDLVYAGVLLPKSVDIFNSICSIISRERSLFQNIRFHFIGTGKQLNDPNSFYVGKMAQQYEGLWQQVIFEYPQRIPYLDVLIHLKASDGIFILGSTEPHYTPSKVYQGALSGRPVLALLHRQSTARQVIQSSGCGIVVGFSESDFQQVLEKELVPAFQSFLELLPNYNFNKIDLGAFSENSAKSVTAKLVMLLEEAGNLR